MKRGLTLIALCSAALAADSPGLRRLTHAQYNNTVRDLLGDQTRPADFFPPEDTLRGFKNQVEAQGVSPLLAEAYSAAAERLARNAFRGGDTNGLIPCKPAQRECAARFIREFGRKAYRRPLRTEEVRRFERLFTASGDFLKGAQTVVEAVLQSPNFLFHTEEAPYDIASRLAYFIWDSMPDEALFRAAASGELKTLAGVETQARRMLADPRAREALDQFVSQWLHFDGVLSTVKDRRLYPQFTPELGQAMVEETRRLVNYLVWEDRNFMDLFTAEYTFVNSELAELYGIPAPREEFALVKLPADRDRAGLLGQASFLTQTSKPGDTSPTVRGMFVREQFLCQKIPDPPPGTAASLPPITEDKPVTNRERLQTHFLNPSCAGCHTLMDPIGFGFEKYDAIGRRREKLKLQFLPHPGRERRGDRYITVELPLDTTGQVAGIKGSQFSSPKDLGRILADSPLCQTCVARQLFRYALGRAETSNDEGAIKQAFTEFRDSGFRFKQLMMAIVRSPQFRGTQP
jgi:hypothetical protein